MKRPGLIFLSILGSLLLHAGFVMIALEATKWKEMVELIF